MPAPHDVLDEVFELFLALGANERQLDFPTVYTIAKQGIARSEMEIESNDLTPLFQAIVTQVPPPPGGKTSPSRCLSQQSTTTSILAGSGSAEYSVEQSDSAHR